MTYVKGQLIAAADINSFTGSGGISLYASQAAVNAVAPAVGALWGQGYGDRGYGQTSPTFSVVNVGDTVGSAEWDGMTDALRTILTNQQGSAPALMPPDGTFNVGETVIAHESSSPSNNQYDLNSLIQTADTNRFDLSVSSATLATIAGTSSNTRATSWGSGTTGIVHELTVDFTTAEKARFFFNSGGIIRLSLTHPSGTAQDSNWRDALINKIGVISFNATETVTSGSVALSSSLGYYDLTDSYQTVIAGTNVGTLSYAANDVLVEARRSNTTTTNGANGIGVRFRVSLTDQHTSSFSDSVSAGTSIVYSVYKSALLSNPIIETPTGTLNNGF